MSIQSKRAKGDVRYLIPNRKTPIAWSTKATSDMISIIAEENPNATIEQLKTLITYDIEAKNVLQAYIDKGYGNWIASEHFEY